MPNKNRFQAGIELQIVIKYIYITIISANFAGETVKNKKICR